MVQIKVMVWFISQGECNRDIERFNFGRSVRKFVLVQEDPFECSEYPAPDEWIRDAFLPVGGLCERMLLDG